MFLLGHLGVTLGVFFILSYLVPGIRGRINYLYVIFGAILPDIIDKLLGRIIFPYSLASGRLIAHTLAFSLILALVGFYQYRRRDDIRILLVSGASFLHLLEDNMWTEPAILLWPLLGWSFPRGVPENRLDYFLVVFRNSYMPGFTYDFVSETLGFIIIMLFVLKYLFFKGR
ncbi:LexA-binding, inner membrane-associated putative hydrolase [uncultured archaeon]|nr:LexA-binding, inner membrane-associated putative hydrolase [uncultured archaeon]